MATKPVLLFELLFIVEHTMFEVFSVLYLGVMKNYITSLQFGHLHCTLPPHSHRHVTVVTLLDPRALSHAVVHTGTQGPYIPALYVPCTLSSVGARLPTSLILTHML